jgi:hypothetical protein
MRAHPISPVTEPMQYRAIGVVRGQYLPTDPAQPTRGLIRTADGTELEAVVLGRLLTLMRRHLAMDKPHLWVVYPRNRDQNQLHLQMVGVWEPSTLSHAGSPGDDDQSDLDEPGLEPAGLEQTSEIQVDDLPAGELPAAEPQPGDTADTGSPAAVSQEIQSDGLAEGDDYFSVRGELIYTRPETGDLVVKVRQQPRADGSRPIPFKLQLRGEVPLEHLRHFVSLDLRRQGQQLCLEALQVLAPLAQRGTRGGKGRRPANAPAGGGAERRGGGGGERRSRDGGGARAAEEPARNHGQAISRPSR